MANRKQKRQDDVRQSPVAEAIAIGTAAGGLVLATSQALASSPDQQTPTTDAIDRLELDQALRADHQAAERDVLPSAPIVTPPADIEQAKGDLDPISVAPIAQVATTGPAEGITIPHSIPAPLQDQLVAQLSELMTSTLVKAVGAVEPGQSVAEISQSMASEIVTSAHQIVANIDIGALLAGTQGLSDEVGSLIDTPALVAEVLNATSGIADGVLAQTAVLGENVIAEALGATSSIAGTLEGELSGVSGTILDTVALGDVLSDLPSSLLGNDGPEGPGGLLAEVFYADGAGDGLDIPSLGTVASSTVTDLGSVTGLLGLNYTDVSESGGTHGLNALSLL